MTITVYVHVSVIEEFLAWMKNPKPLVDSEEKIAVAQIIPDWGKWVTVNLTVDEWYIVNDNLEFC